MLHCKSAFLALLTAFSAGAAGSLCPAQQARPLATVRYHFGDDPDGKLGWSSPTFDDSEWPLAQNGRRPPAPLASDGFGWLRMRVPVRSDVAEPLAIRVSRKFTGALSYSVDQTYEVFVNGKLVAKRGRFPPDAELAFSPEGSVFELPSGLVTPGTTAVVCYRLWLSPSQRWGSDSNGFEIESSRNLILANKVNELSSVVAIGPELGLTAIIGILGIGLFIFWRWAGGRELLWCSGILLLWSIQGVLENALRFGVLVLPWRAQAAVTLTLEAAGMAVSVEFIWSIFNVRGRGWKRWAQLSLVVFNLGMLYMGWITAANIALPLVSGTATAAIDAFNLTIIGVGVWAFFANRRNRLFAATLMIAPVAATLTGLGVDMNRKIGIFYFDLFKLGEIITSLALFVMLGQRAWTGWRARDELQAEFDAAREVQEQLVAPAANVSGFRIESAYAPAKQVGGDFFRVMPGKDGGVLVAVGDVSGKGLKAAMTVSAIMGALRGCSSHEPAGILQYLNGVLYGQVNGFVTCCATFIAKDGTMTFANAGNPAPYRNGKEMETEPGLPLGILADANYVESRFQIAPGEQLTFVSDGVIEATNPHGELFGFERAQAISSQPASAIADAAKQFGQEDDITVVTLMRESVEATAGEGLSAISVSAEI